MSLISRKADFNPLMARDSGLAPSTASLMKLSLAVDGYQVQGGRVRLLLPPDSFNGLAPALSMP